MGAFYDDDISLSNQPLNPFPLQDRRLLKHVHDNVHGSIYLDQIRGGVMFAVRSMPLGRNFGEFPSVFSFEREGFSLSE
ncbi:hypothetical protein ACLOJK_032448 [Asimina triloba]